MKKRISKKLFRALVKEIRQVAESMGTKINLYYRPIIWNRHGSDGPNFGEVRGFHECETRKIVVTCHGKASRRQLLHVLAHELRHAIHYRDGLYKDYYDPEYYAMVALLKAGLELPPQCIQRPSNKIAHLAEMDCNRFAIKWVKERGLEPYTDSISYPYHATSAYGINMYLDEKGY